MTVPRLIYRNVTRNPFRSGVVFSCAFLLAALPFAVTFITEGGRASLQRVLGRLGADLLIVPEGAEVKVETALLMGKPTPVWMPRENLDKIAPNRNWWWPKRDRHSSQISLMRPMSACAPLVRPLPG